MFTDILEELKKGRLPTDMGVLKKRFGIAITKKMAVLKLPYHFWSSDTKINPSTEQLAWVSLLLEDSECYTQVDTVIALELSVRSMGKKVSEDSHLVVQEYWKEICGGFLNFAPDSVFRQVLAEKIHLND